MDGSSFKRKQPDSEKRSQFDELRNIFQKSGYIACIMSSFEITESDPGYLINFFYKSFKKFGLLPSSLEIGIPVATLRYLRTRRIDTLDQEAKTIVQKGIELLSHFYALQANGVDSLPQTLHHRVAVRRLLKFFIHVLHQTLDQKKDAVFVGPSMVHFQEEFASTDLERCMQCVCLLFDGIKNFHNDIAASTFEIVLHDLIHRAAYLGAPFTTKKNRRLNPSPALIFALSYICDHSSGFKWWITKHIQLCIANDVTNIQSANSFDPAVKTAFCSEQTKIVLAPVLLLALQRVAISAAGTPLGDNFVQILQRISTKNDVQGDASDFDCTTFTKIVKLCPFAAYARNTLNRAICELTSTQSMNHLHQEDASDHCFEFCIAAKMMTTVLGWSWMYDNILSSTLWPELYRNAKIGAQIDGSETSEYAKFTARCLLHILLSIVPEMNSENSFDSLSYGTACVRAALHSLGKQILPNFESCMLQLGAPKSDAQSMRLSSRMQAEVVHALVQLYRCTSSGHSLVLPPDIMVWTQLEGYKKNIVIRLEILAAEASANSCAELFKI